MRKLILFAAVVMLIIIVGIIFIHQKDVETDVTAQKTKVGVILNSNRKDRSWSQSHYEGMESAAKEINLYVYYREEVPENEESVQVINELIKEGCKIIILNSFGYEKYALKCAKENPDVYFFHAGGVHTAKNLSTCFGKMYQMRYLSGIVAGIQTKSNEIGYVAAYNISEVNRGINAFALGVRSVNPKAAVYVEFINSWFDDNLTRKATENLLNRHGNIDLLAMHTNSLEPLKIANEKGLLSIGYNLDNSNLFPNSFLTAPVWKWENFYTPYILECMKGKFSENNYWEGAETGLIELAEFNDKVSPDAVEKVNEVKDKLLNGNFDVFYGPVYDNKGNLRIAKGENMSDYSMLNEFDWFAEGVVIDE